MSDVTIRRGDSRVLAITDAVDAAGAAYAWTDDQIRFTVKRSLADSDAEAVFQKTRESGAIVPGAAGEATIRIDPADTAGLPDQAIVLEWDLQVTTAAGDVHTLDSGRITVDPEVTRS